MARKPKEPVQVDKVGVALWRWEPSSNGSEGGRGRYFETEATAYPGGADGELESLTCECGRESDASEWPAFEPETVCSCPGCGAFFRLTVPKGEEIVEPVRVQAAARCGAEEIDTLDGGIYTCTEAEEHTGPHKGKNLQEGGVAQWPNKGDREIPDLVVEPARLMQAAPEVEQAPQPQPEPAELPESVAHQIQALTEEWMDLAFLLEQMADEKKIYLDGWKERAGKASKRVREIRGEIQAIKSGATEPPQVSTPHVDKRQAELFAALDD